MSKEAFEEWAAGCGYTLEINNGKYVNAETKAAFAGYEARQFEIDNLLARIGALAASNNKWKELHTDLTKQFLDAQQEMAGLEYHARGNDQKDRKD